MSLSSQPIPKYVRKLLQQSLEVHLEFDNRLQQLAKAAVDNILSDEAGFIRLCTAFRNIERNIESLQFDYLIAADTTYVLERYMELQCPFDKELTTEDMPVGERSAALEEELVDMVEEYLEIWPAFDVSPIHRIATEKAGLSIGEVEEMKLPQLAQAILDRQPKLKQQEWDILHAALIDSTMQHQSGLKNLEEAVENLTPLYLEEGQSFEEALRWAERTRQLTQKWREQRGKPQELVPWLEHTDALIAPFEEEEDENVFPLSDNRQDQENWEDWNPLRNPKFQTGSMVRVTAPVVPDPDYPDITAEGWHGWVENAMTDGSQNDYIINLDGQTLQSLPPAFIKSSCEAFMTPDATRFRFSEEQLQAVSAREKPEDTRAVQRDICHRYFWGDVEQDNQAARIHRILMRDPSGTDLENWMNYFNEEVHFPFRARVEGMVLQHIPQGTVVEVLAIEGVDKNGFGMVASIKKGRAILSFPLMELIPAEDGQEEAKALEDYRYWADFMLL